MKYHTKLYRSKNNIPIDQEVNYRHVWEDRMEDIKLMVLTMRLKTIADHYGVTVSNLGDAMCRNNVSANVERHRNKLKLINQ